MAHDPKKQARRKPSDTRLDRAMDLFWAEDLASKGATPAAPAELDVDVELVALEVAGIPVAHPVETPPPPAAAGPFIEAELVKPPATEPPPPFIEAVLVAKPPVSDPPPVAVADWLGDVVPPGPAVPPPPSTAATPDWLAEVADSEAAARPTPPTGEGATPDWLSDL